MTKLQKVPISAFKRLAARPRHPEVDALLRPRHGAEPRQVAAVRRAGAALPARRPQHPAAVLDLPGAVPRLPEHAPPDEVHARQEGRRSAWSTSRPTTASWSPSASAPTQDFDAITWTGPLAKPTKQPRSTRGHAVASSRCARRPACAQHRRPRPRAHLRRPSVELVETTVWPPAPAPDNRGMSPLTLGSLTVPVAGRARADGRDHQRRLPPAVRRAGRGLYVCEMITSRGLVERDSTTLKMLVFDELETHPLGPALRHRPGVRRQGDRDPLRGVRRRPRRPQLRLPGAQGDPQGRRAERCPGSAGCSPRSCGPRSPLPRRTTCRSP